ncbi:unnamed protein product, partial [Iphiclides podalirius]
MSSLFFTDFECAGDEVLVESSPPASPDMAARLAAPTQGAATSAGDTSPTTVRELIVIPELPSSIHLQHAIQQVSNNVVEVNGDSSGQSSPNAEQHTYIAVTSEGGNGVNYHVQYVEPQEIYTQGAQGHMEPLRTYPVYGVASVANGSVAGVGVAVEGVAVEGAAEGAWAGEFAFSGASGEPDAPTSPGPSPRMPPATVQWLLDHYETAEGVSLPRSTLYAHYLRHCTAHRLEPVNAASFGKLIRSVFVGLRTRRLGTRGNSKYHYYGIRAKPGHEPAPSPADKHDLSEHDSQEEREPEPSVGAGPVGGIGMHRQYLGCATPPDPPPLRLDHLPPDVPPEAAEALRRHHREHGAEFLAAVAALDVGAVERARRAFWRRPLALCRRTLLKLFARDDVAHWLRRADLQLHQRAVDLLLPDVLRPIPSQLTQSIRNFAKNVECALSEGGGAAAGAAGRAQAAAAGALSAALRRYTSLNHLAQAARAVLTNHTQIQQRPNIRKKLIKYMLSDLNRVDFRVVREQAAWACACGVGAHAHRLEADFKATLGRGASLEQWAAWLEGCVRGALAPHERRKDFTARARRLLLDWSFYSSLVIRELTLRSAASFGSFHLIRLLYDEYVSFLIERRVAAHCRLPQIAVMQRALEEDEEVAREGARGSDEGGERNGHGEADGEGGGAKAEENELEPEPDRDWDWDDDDEDEDEDAPHQPGLKRPKLN